MAGSPLSALGWRLGQADEDVELEVFLAQELDLFAFDDLDSAVAIRERVTVLGDPRGGHHDSLRGVLVFHDAGEGAYRLDAYGAAVPLGLDDAQAAKDGILVDRYPVDAVVLR